MSIPKVIHQPLPTKERKLVSTSKGSRNRPISGDGNDAAHSQSYSMQLFEIVNSIENVRDWNPHQRQTLLKQLQQQQRCPLFSGAARDFPLSQSSAAAVGLAINRQSHDDVILINFELTRLFRTEMERECPDPQLIDWICQCLHTLHSNIIPKDSTIQILQKEEVTAIIPCFLRAWRIFFSHESISSRMIEMIGRWIKTSKDKSIVRKLMREPTFTDCLQDTLLMESSSNEQLQLLILHVIKDILRICTDNDNAIFFARLALMTCIEKFFSRPMDNQSQSSTISVCEIYLLILWKMTTISSIAHALAVDRRFWNVLRQISTSVLSLDIGDESSRSVHCHYASCLGCMLAFVCAEKKKTKQSGCAHEIILTLRSNDMDWVLPYVLTTLRRSEPRHDQDLRRRSLRILLCLVNCTWGRRMFVLSGTGTMAKPEAMVNECMTVLIQVLRNAHDSTDVRSLSCQIISLLTRYLIHHDHEDEDSTDDEEDHNNNYSHWLPILETLFVRVVEDPETPHKVVAIVCEALHACWNEPNHHESWIIKRGPFNNCTNAFVERLLSVLQENRSDPHVHRAISCVLLFQIQSTLSFSSFAEDEGRLLHLFDAAAILLQRPSSTVSSSSSSFSGGGAGGGDSNDSGGDRSSTSTTSFEASREQGVLLLETIIRAAQHSDSIHPHNESNHHHNTRTIRLMKTMMRHDALLESLISYCLNDNQNHKKKTKKKKRVIQIFLEFAHSL